MDISQSQNSSSRPIQIPFRKIVGSRRAVGPRLLGRAKDAPAPANESLSPVTIPCQEALILKRSTSAKLGKCWSSTYSVLKEALHIKTGKYYACKMINKKLVAGREFIIWNEIAVLKRVSNVRQNIVTVYLVFDLFSGGSLFDRISVKGIVTLPNWFIQIITAADKMLITTVVHVNLVLSASTERNQRQSLIYWHYHTSEFLESSMVNSEQNREDVELSGEELVASKLAALTGGPIKQILMAA
ncbi:hypothetical protein F5888DRAFT_1634361 [Russula emetica]|nr:hypothetical protein F5888DRAFT_1634361 [Russula emetica]